jgi:nitroreductase
LDGTALLTTTRAVRKRLDLGRPVERALVEECVEIATQAPAGGNRHRYQFVLVDDDEKKQALGEVYSRAFADYVTRPNVATGGVLDSARHLAEHLSEVPVIVIPCMSGRVEGLRTSHRQAGYWGSVYPAVWSFMLAARDRGLGTALTTMHLVFEEECAAILGIPSEEVTQVCLLPVAHTIGESFSPGKRSGGPFWSWNGWTGARAAG